MGSVSASYLQTHHFSITSYSSYNETNPLLTIHPSISSILKHKTSNTLIQQYKITLIDENQLTRTFQFFQWRLRQKYIVNTMYFFYNQEKRVCSQSYSGSLYTERIPLKLRDIGGIPYPENLYVLHSVLNGFKTLSDMLGYFQPQEDMVGIDSQGNIKVWVNDNLSLNYPEKGINAQIDEHQMVKQVLQMIAINTERRKDVEDASTYCLRYLKQQDKFSECLQYLTNYQKINKINLPDKFYCMLDILNKKDNIDLEKHKISKLKQKQKISLNDSKKTETSYFRNPIRQRQQYIQRSTENSMQKPIANKQLQKYLSPCLPDRQVLSNLRIQKNHFPYTVKASKKTSSLILLNQTNISNNIPPPSRKISQFHSDQHTPIKKCATAARLKFKQSTSIIYKSPQSELQQKKLSDPQLTHTPSRTSLLQHQSVSQSFHTLKLSNKFKHHFKTVESVTSKQNINRYCDYVVSEEALLSESNATYDQITYRSPHQRHIIDPMIAKDLKMYGFM